MSYIQSLLSIILLTASTSFAAQADHGGDHDGGNEFELITCIAELGFFEIRPLFVWGSSKHIYYADPKVAKDFHERTGHIAHNKEATAWIYEDSYTPYSGTCAHDDAILTWEYLNIPEPGHGNCGGGDWGGRITIRINDVIFIDHLHIGGDPISSGCRGARLQSLRIIRFDSTSMVGSFKGYWHSENVPYLEIPVDTNKMQHLKPACIPRKEYGPKCHNLKAINFSGEILPPQ